MGTSGNPFFSWLASQPAFIEVGLGMAFCLVIAPVLLALVAAALTSIEAKLARILSESGVLTPGSAQASRNRWEPLRHALGQELRKVASKRQA
jgi:hypothetical protein